MPVGDPACFRPNRVAGSADPLAVASRPFGMAARRVRKHDQALGQWSNSALPHGASECR